MDTEVTIIDSDSEHDDVINLDSGGESQEDSDDVIIVGDSRDHRLLSRGGNHGNQLNTTTGAGRALNPGNTSINISATQVSIPTAGTIASNIPTPNTMVTSQQHLPTVTSSALTAPQAVGGEDTSAGLHGNSESDINAAAESMKMFLWGVFQSIRAQGQNLSSAGSGDANATTGSDAMPQGHAISSTSTGSDVTPQALAPSSMSPGRSVMDQCSVHVKDRLRQYLATPHRNHHPFMCLLCRNVFGCSQELYTHYNDQHSPSVGSNPGTGVALLPPGSDDIRPMVHEGGHGPPSGVPIQQENGAVPHAAGDSNGVPVVPSPPVLPVGVVKPLVARAPEALPSIGGNNIPPSPAYSKISQASNSVATPSPGVSGRINTKCLNDGQNRSASQDTALCNRIETAAPNSPSITAEAPLETRRIDTPIASPEDTRSSTPASTRSVTPASTTSGSSNSYECQVCKKPFSSLKGAKSHMTKTHHIKYHEYSVNVDVLDVKNELDEGENSTSGSAKRSQKMVTYVSLLDDDDLQCMPDINDIALISDTESETSTENSKTDDEPYQVNTKQSNTDTGQRNNSVQIYRRRHMEAPVCHLCNISLPTMCELRDHYGAVHDITDLYLCNSCQDIFGIYDVYLKHERKCMQRRARKSKSDYSNTSGGVRKPYYSPAETVKISGTWSSCKICGFKSRGFARTWKHQMLEHQLLYVFNCRSCRLQFNEVTSYNQHRKTCVRSKSLFDVACLAVSESTEQGTASSGGVCVSRTVSFTCGVCEEKLPNEQELTAHMNNDHDL